MGNIFSWFQSAFANKKASIVMVGLDNAGKTAILLKLKLNEVSETVPTIGFNVETVEYKNVCFNIWDVGGQTRLRSFWRHYYDGANAVIFVIDANDRERLNDAHAELQRLLSDPLLASATLLVFCNKQDLPRRLAPAEVVERLGLLVKGNGSAEQLAEYRRMNNSGGGGSGENKEVRLLPLGPLVQGRAWYVQGCCAMTGEGLLEGLDWLCGHLPNNN